MKEFRRTVITFLYGTFCNFFKNFDISAKFWVFWYPYWMCAKMFLKGHIGIIFNFPVIYLLTIISFLHLKLSGLQCLTPKILLRVVYIVTKENSGDIGNLSNIRYCTVVTRTTCLFQFSHQIDKRNILPLPLFHKIIRKAREH